MKIEIFISEGCHFCPSAVEMAKRYANRYKEVELEVINYWERKDLVEKYKIRLVPTIVVNGRIAMIGAPNSYEEFVEKIASHGTCGR